MMQITGWVIPWGMNPEQSRPLDPLNNWSPALSTSAPIPHCPRLSHPSPKSVTDSIHHGSDELCHGPGLAIWE